MLSHGENAQTAIAFSLNDTFGPVLKKQMVRGKKVALGEMDPTSSCLIFFSGSFVAWRAQDHYNNNPTADQFSAVHSKIDDARNVMLDNIGTITAPP